MDIGPFVLALISPSGYQFEYPWCDMMLGDINQDEAVDGVDVQPFVGLLLP